MPTVEKRLAYYHHLYGEEGFKNNGMGGIYFENAGALYAYQVERGHIAINDTTPHGSALHTAVYQGDVRGFQYLIKMVRIPILKVKKCNHLLVLFKKNSLTLPIIM